MFRISTHALTWSATATDTVIENEHGISTHALTWSATPKWFTAVRFVPISTHALTWSATFFQVPNYGIWGFQLTHSRGVRPDEELEKRKQETISTHALTWSAT